MRILHLTTHTHMGGITVYIKRLIRPLRKLDAETFIVSSGGDCTEALRAEGAELFELPIRTKNILHPKLWFSLPRLISILKDQKIDLIHAHTRITQVLGAAASRLTGIPMVTTSHGFYKPKIGRKWLPCWGNKVIAISGMVKEHLEKDFRVPEDRIRLISNAVNTKELEDAYRQKDIHAVKRSYGFSPDDPVVGIIARLVGDKGHDYLIRCVPILKKRFPSIRILIVGEGRFRDPLKALAAELKITDHVRFCGNITDITEPLAAMDIFALPATWREGFGLSMIEAMTCRKPVIVTNIRALNSLIEDRVTGLIVEPKQVEPLADAIAELLENKSLREGLIERGYAFVTQRFSIESMAQELASLYREMTPGKILTP